MEDKNLNILIFFIIKIQMTEQQNPTLQSSHQSKVNSQQSFCKNHPNTKSGFFSVEQPWLKYCQACALNMALCGKKIQKELNSKQFSNKLILSSLMIDLSNTILEADQASKSYLAIVKVLQKNNDPFKEKISELDELIKMLTIKKEQLNKMYERTISHKISQCYEKQNNLVLAQIQLRKSIENVQCNYTNLLIQQEIKIQQSISEHQAKIQICKQFMPVPSYQEDILKNIHETAHKFKSQFQALSKFRIDMGWLKQYGIDKDLTSRKNSRQKTSRWNSTMVQNKQNFQNSLFSCIESKFCCSTNPSGRSSTIASGLQSIADMEPILQQFDGKKHNKAHLQLRCSKVKQKRQKSIINVDVKQERKSSTNRLKTNF